MKPIFVGQAPGKNKIENDVLGGLLGERLAKKSGLDPSAFSSAFEAMNVLDDNPGKHGKGDAFPVKRGEGTKVVVERTAAGQVVLMLGRAVARACGVKGKTAYLEYFDWEGRRAAIVPHPSGINLWWNVKANRDLAGLFFSSFAGQQKAGENQKETPTSSSKPRPVPKPAKAKN